MFCCSMVFIMSGAVLLCVIVGYLFHSVTFKMASQIDLSPFFIYCCAFMPILCSLCPFFPGP